MLPEDIQIVIQNLNKAWLMVKPSHEAKNLFFNQLLDLLVKTGNYSYESGRGFLEKIFINNSLLTNYAEVETLNSPVCYAKANGLRAEFNDTDLPDTNTVFERESKIKSGVPVGNYLPEKPGLLKALQLTKKCIFQIIFNQPVNLQIDTLLLEEDINHLISELYQLNLEEISTLKDLKYLP